MLTRDTDWRQGDLLTSDAAAMLTALLNSAAGDSITVMRCLNSTTTTDYPQGKTRAQAVVIDGIEYELIPKKDKK